jgi:hypothetical protein
MQEIVAYCGLVCTECPAYVATQKNDNQARAKVAEEWSKQFQHNFKTEDINCNGCLAVDEVQFGYSTPQSLRLRLNWKLSEIKNRYAGHSNLESEITILYSILQFPS